MKKITSLLLMGALLIGTAACSNEAKTSADAPTSTDKQATPATQAQVQSTKDDAASKVRRDQLNADIRAREQRNNTTGGDADRDNADLASEVRSKLEANLPTSSLTIAAKDGAVSVSGNVLNEKDLAKIEPLSKQIKGVQTVALAVNINPNLPEKKN